MEKEKKFFHVDVEKVSGEHVEGLALKNMTINNLSLPELTMVCANLLHTILKLNSEEQNEFKKGIDEFFINTVILATLNGNMDFDKIDSDSKAEFLEHCFRMKGEE